MCGQLLVAGGLLPPPPPPAAPPGGGGFACEVCGAANGAGVGACAVCGTPIGDAGVGYDGTGSLGSSRDSVEERGWEDPDAPRVVCSACTFEQARVGDGCAMCGTPFP